MTHAHKATPRYEAGYRHSASRSRDRTARIDLAGAPGPCSPPEPPPPTTPTMGRHHGQPRTSRPRSGSWSHLRTAPSALGRRLFDPAGATTRLRSRGRDPWLLEPAQGRPALPKGAAPTRTLEHRTHGLSDLAVTSHRRQPHRRSLPGPCPIEPSWQMATLESTRERVQIQVRGAALATPHHTHLGTVISQGTASPLHRHHHPSWRSPSPEPARIGPRQSRTGDRDRCEAPPRDVSGIRPRSTSSTMIPGGPKWLDSPALYFLASARRRSCPAHGQQRARAMARARCVDPCLLTPPR